MVYSTMNKPSKNMQLSATELSEMTRAQINSIYEAEQEKAMREQAAANREREEYYNQHNRYINERASAGRNRAEFLQNVKEAFLCECIMRLYNESVGHPMTSKDQVVARNLVVGFVRENGAGNLLSNFATKNILLSEMSRISQKYYDRVLESVSAESIVLDDDGSYTIDNTIKDDFYTELEDLDVADASKLIRDRVADAIQQFIDTNASTKMDCEEIIQQAQEKMATAKNEAMVEEYSNIARRRVNELKLTRPKNVFNVMVEALTRKTLTDESYAKQYMTEASVDMEAIVDSTQLIYTMLEMVNTTCMVNVNEEFISRYLESLA